MRLASIFAPPDLDYVERFQVLQRLNVQIRDAGPTTARLLQKSTLEAEVGNQSAALAAAKDAMLLEPNNPECRYMVARGYIIMALAKAEAIALGPNQNLPVADARRLLEAASTELDTCLRLNPADEQAEDARARIKTALGGHDDAIVASLQP